MSVFSKVYMPADVANHVVWGVIVAALTTVAVDILVPGTKAEFLGAAAAGAVGILKELYDYGTNYFAKKKGLPAPHGVQLHDVIATIAGGWLVVLSQVAA